MIWLAAIAGLSVFGLTAIVLKMLADDREMRRILAPQIRLVAPPKEPAAKDGEFLAGPPFAGGTEAGT